MVPKNSIDYVIDIESSYFYPNKDAFLREVNSVLKEDGMFFWGCMVPRSKLDKKYQLINKYFDIVKDEDITDNVVRSLKLDSTHVSRFIESNFPWCKQLSFSYLFSYAFPT